VVANVVAHQRSTRSRTGLDSHPLQQVHNSPHVLSPSRPEITLDSIPEERFHTDQPNYHHHQTNTPSAHAQAQGDESLSTEVMPSHGSSTLQTIPYPSEEHSNASSSAVIPSIVSTLSHRSSQPSINPTPYTISSGK